MTWQPRTTARTGIASAAAAAVLTSAFAVGQLERLEGNVLRVYPDRLANNLPTYCAGMTDRAAPVGTQLTSDTCRAVNGATLIEYGAAVLRCLKWDNVSGYRLIAITLFAINVGKDGACGSRAVRLLNAGRIAEGCRALAFGPDGRPAWSYAGGVFVQGLLNRRIAEADICTKEGSPP